MELSMSGSSLRTFGRCVTFLARVASELVLQAHPAKLEMHTLNSSRSAYASISLARDFFDQYHLDAAASAPSSTPLQCSVLLKSLLAVLRTPHAALDRLAVSLPEPDAPKLQITLHCLNGVRKTYWIVCSAEPEVQSLSLDRGRFPSRLAIRPRELARLLSNFQSSLQELTIIATDPASGLPDASGDVGGKAVELRSYNDPTKDDCDTRLHTQLWIDPAEEFVEFVHAGDPVDVTFGVKELKAFLTFCEGCEVDILLFFEKTGEPVLLVPRFGLDDGAASDFEATLVLATMTVSQLSDSDDAQQPATSAQNAGEPGAAAPTLVPENVSNHTKIWSELSGSTPKSIEANRENHAQKKRNASTNMLNDMSMLPNVTNAPSKPPVADNANNIMQPLQMDHMEERPG
uniref:Cell cycle checkpoint control protein family n=1 Tax=Zea mays TaxID=4577 RepID=A0A804LK53_MAIZE